VLPQFSQRVHWRLVQKRQPALSLLQACDLRACFVKRSHAGRAGGCARDGSVSAAAGGADEGGGLGLRLAHLHFPFPPALALNGLSNSPPPRPPAPRTLIQGLGKGFFFSGLSGCVRALAAADCEVSAGAPGAWCARWCCGVAAFAASRRPPRGLKARLNCLNRLLEMFGGHAKTISLQSKWMRWLPPLL
jgi:hypothetical protein